MSPFQQHQARALGEIGAAQAAAAAGLRTGAAASAYELERARLGVDLRRLKEIQSIERKIELKRELLPGYAPWVEGVMAADIAGETGVQDEILVHMMIWLIDVGDFAAALPLAHYVLRWKLNLPERFDRTPATLVVEEIAEAALKQLGQDQDADFAILEQIVEISIGYDMPDEVRAKAMKAVGLQLVRHFDRMESDADGAAGVRRATAERALRCLRRAYELDARCGVKKAIDRLERAVRKVVPIDAAAENEGAPASD